MEQRLFSAENALQQILERNRRVEADKAWEISITRRLFITVVTYLVTTPVFILLGAKNPWTNALIPCAGYLISTLTLPLLKARWLAARGEKS